LLSILSVIFSVKFEEIFVINELQIGENKRRRRRSKSGGGDNGGSNNNNDNHDDEGDSDSSKGHNDSGRPRGVRG